MEGSGPSSTRRGATPPFDKLPEAIILQILNRVPGNKDFLDYRAVCRAWRALCYQAQCLYHPYGGYRRHIEDSKVLSICASISKLLPALTQLNLDARLREPSLAQIAKFLPHLQDLSVQHVTIIERSALFVGHSKFELLRKLCFRELETTKEEFYKLLDLCPRLEGLRFGDLRIESTDDDSERHDRSLEVNCPRLKEFEIVNSYYIYGLARISLHTPLLEVLRVDRLEPPFQLHLGEHQLTRLRMSVNPPFAGQILLLPKVTELTLLTPDPSWSGHYNIPGGWERVLRMMVDPCLSLKSPAVPQKPPTRSSIARKPDPHACDGNQEPAICIARFCKQFGTLQNLEIDRDLFGNLMVSPSDKGFQYQLPCLLKITVSLGAPLTEQNVSCLKWFLDKAPALWNMHLRVKDFGVCEDSDALNMLGKIQREYSVVNFATF